MGDNKNDLLTNEQALSEEELNKVTAGLGFFDFLASLFGKKHDAMDTKAGLGRPINDGISIGSGVIK